MGSALYNLIPPVYTTYETVVPQFKAIFFGTEPAHEKLVGKLMTINHLDEGRARKVVYPYKDMPRDEKINTFTIHAAVGLSISFLAAHFWDVLIPDSIYYKPAIKVLAAIVTANFIQNARDDYSLTVRYRRLVETPNR